MKLAAAIGKWLGVSPGKGNPLLVDFLPHLNTARIHHSLFLPMNVTPDFFSPFLGDSVRGYPRYYLTIPVSLAGLKPC